MFRPLFLAFLLFIGVCWFILLHGNKMITLQLSMILCRGLQNKVKKNVFFFVFFFIAENLQQWNIRTFHYVRENSPQNRSVDWLTGLSRLLYSECSNSMYECMSCELSNIYTVFFSTNLYIFGHRWFKMRHVNINMKAKKIKRSVVDCHCESWNLQHTKKRYIKVDIIDSNQAT